MQQHFTKAERLEIARIDEFNRLMEIQLNASSIQPKEAKVCHRAIKFSLRYTKSNRIHFLNIRYAFSKANYMYLPLEINSLINFLELNQPTLDWNSVLMRLEILWQPEW